MEKIQRNCGRCGVVLLAYESDIMLRCPPCSRLDNQEAAASIGWFVRNYGWFSFFLFLSWVVSVPMTFLTIIGVQTPFSGIWTLILIFMPFWGLFHEMGLALRFSCLFLIIMLLIVIDDYFISGFILKATIARLIP